jgi:hypothetical protein
VTVVLAHAQLCYFPAAARGHPAFHLLNALGVDYGIHPGCGGFGRGMAQTPAMASPASTSAIVA